MSSCSLVVLSALALGVSGVPFTKTCLGPDLPETFSLTMEYRNYLVRFNKEYPDEEWASHYYAFEESYNLVRNETQQQNKYTLELNRFADLELPDIQKTFLGVSIPDTGLLLPNSLQQPLSINDTSPGSVDWTEAGAVTDVKDQGVCASCWAFAATGALESAYMIASHPLESLSEQELINGTNGVFMNIGCRGGWMFTAFEFVADNGLATEDSLPYTSYNGTGDGPELNLGGSVEGIPANVVSGYVWATQTASSLRAAVVLQPVTAAIEVSTMSFVLYSKGVLAQPTCGKNVNHAILVTGYNVEDDDPFWLIKNSWGSEWGDGGYIKLAMTLDSTMPYDTCGIAGYVFYPVLNS